MGRTNTATPLISIAPVRRYQRSSFFVGISNLFVEENQRLFDADLIYEEETAHAASVVPLRNALLATYGDAYIAG